MAARSIGSLTISFGLIAIPVELFSATQSSGNAISFNLLHKGCGSRVKQQYLCVKEGTVVPREDMVKGYEFAKDQYVQFTTEEIKALEEVGSHAVEISDFVSIAAVDPVYYDKTYYLTPSKGATKPYALFTRALADSGRAAIARWATRGSSNLVMLRPAGDVLVMQQLHFDYEVRPPSEMSVPAAEVKPAELQLAKMLIEQQVSETFDPSAYVDEARTRVEAAIQRKVEGHEISVAEAPTATGATNVIDIMEVLKASLEKNRRDKASPSKLGARKPPKRVEPEPVKRASTKRK